MRRRALAVAAVLCSPAAAAAQSQVLEEIEVKARQETRAESLEVREVRESAAQDLGEAVEATPGVAKVRKGGVANDVVIRGYQRDNISVTIDGAELHGACPNRMDPPSFHLDYAEVDRLDVRKGPFDVSRPGSLGGSVEVKTRSPGTGFGAEANAGYGSFDRLEASAVLSYGAERAGGLGGLAWKRSDPYRSGDGREITEVYAPTSASRYRLAGQGGTAYDIRTGWLKAGAVPFEGHRLEASYARQEASDVIYPYLLMDAVYDDTDRVGATWSVERLGPFRAGQARFWWNLVQHDMDDTRRCSSTQTPGACSGALPRPYSMRTLARSVVTGGRLDAVIPGLGGETTAGADLQGRTWDATTTRLDRTTLAYGDQASVPDVTVAALGLFAEHRRPLAEAWRLTAGLRVDLAHTRAAVDRTAVYSLYHPGPLPRSQDDLLVSGNLQADWQVSEPVSLFLGYGHGARVPDPQERYFALSATAMSRGQVGNPTLAPVQNDEVDLGVKWVTAKVLLKAQAFYSLASSYVLVTDVTGTDSSLARTYQNVRATLLGGEASVRVALPWDLFLFGAVAYTRGQNETFEVPLPEIPPLESSLGLRWDSGHLFVEAEGLFAARQSRVDPGLQEAATGAWAILNLKAGGRIAGFRAFAGVRNVLDEFYSEHLSYLRDPYASGVRVPEPGRSFHLDLQYAFP